MVSDGDNSVDRLAVKAKEIGSPGEHTPFSYGWISKADAYTGLRYGTRQHTPSELALKIGRDLYDATEDGDNAVGHSLGAIALWSAMWYGRKFDKVFLFAAAMDEDRLWPAFGMKKLWNVFCKDDRILRIADGLVLSDFGGLGKHGYLGGHDPRIVNVQAHPLTPNIDKWIHNFYFEYPDLDTWAKFIKEKLSAES